MRSFRQSLDPIPSTNMQSRMLEEVLCGWPDTRSTHPVAVLESAAWAACFVVLHNAAWAACCAVFHNAAYPAYFTVCHIAAWIACHAVYDSAAWAAVLLCVKALSVFARLSAHVI